MIVRSKPSSNNGDFGMNSGLSQYILNKNIWLLIMNLASVMFGKLPKHKDRTLLPLNRIAESSSSLTLNLDEFDDFSREILENIIHTASESMLDMRGNGLLEQIIILSMSFFMFRDGNIPLSVSVSNNEVI